MWLIQLLPEVHDISIVIIKGQISDLFICKQLLSG